VIANVETNEHSCVPIKFYLQKQTGGQIWQVDQPLLTPILEEKSLEISNGSQPWF
jgi:hypothetical protein